MKAFDVPHFIEFMPTYMALLKRINHFYILTFVMVLIYALENYMQSLCSALLTVLPDE